jgi:hypothetical protein
LGPPLIAPTAPVIDHPLEVTGTAAALTI